MIIQLRKLIKHRLFHRKIVGINSDTSLEIRNSSEIKKINEKPKEMEKKTAKSDDITSDEELHPHWATLERRLNSRRPKNTGKTGRENLKSTAWDAEHV